MVSKSITKLNQYTLRLLENLNGIIGWSGTFIREKTCGMAKSGLAMFYADFFGWDAEDFVEFCSTIRHFVDISPVSLLNLGDDCLHGEIQPFVEGYRSWGFFLW